MLGAIALIRKLSFEYVAAADLTKPSIPDLAALITSWLDNPSDAATAEKNALIERLRGYFDETSRDKLLERRATENDFLQKELNKVPYTIYIG